MVPAAAQTLVTMRGYDDVTVFHASGRTGFAGAPFIPTTMMTRHACALLVTLTLAGPTVAAAQMGGGMGPPGGMGGGGARGGPPMGGRPGESLTREFREMARLKPLLKGLSLSDVQTDSL